MKTEADAANAASEGGNQAGVTEVTGTPGGTPGGETPARTRDTGPIVVCTLGEDGALRALEAQPKAPDNRDKVKVKAWMKNAKLADGQYPLIRILETITVKTELVSKTTLG
jgi:hypothetical protein